MTTSIYKEPVRVRVALPTLNLDGDRQSDLTVHGGKYKAVYFYPIEYYSYWQTELPNHSLPYGFFGENFSFDGLVREGLAEDSIHVGDRFSVGSAEVVVTLPRLEDAHQVRRAIAAKALPENWKTYRQEKLNRLHA